MKKRILSLLLILCMAVTLLPTAVFAEEATGTGLLGGQAKIGDTVYPTLEAAYDAYIAALNNEKYDGVRGSSGQ